MWLKFPGSVSLIDIDRQDEQDLRFSFLLRSEVGGREFAVAIWRDVVFRCGPNAHSSWIGPTEYRSIGNPELRAFFDRLDRIGLRRLKRYYDPISLYGVDYLDGWSWQLFWRFRDRVYQSKGDNAFPYEFDDLCSAIDHLTHINGFYEATKRAQIGTKELRKG